MSDIIITNTDVDTDIATSIPGSSIPAGIGGCLLAKLHHPIRPNLADFIEPGIGNDFTTAQFTDIADIITTGMGVDTDLPAGASGG